MMRIPPSPSPPLARKGDLPSFWMKCSGSFENEKKNQRRQNRHPLFFLFNVEVKQNKKLSKLTVCLLKSMSEVKTLAWHTHILLHNPRTHRHSPLVTFRRYLDTRSVLGPRARKPIRVSAKIFHHDPMHNTISPLSLSTGKSTILSLSLFFLFVSETHGNATIYQLGCANIASRPRQESRYYCFYLLF